MIKRQKELESQDPYSKLNTDRPHFDNFFKEFILSGETDALR